MSAMIFHPSLYDRRQYHTSYWAAQTSVPQLEALQADIQVDVAIIGGGYTGLSCALHLARDFGLETAVLEAGDIGWGASGRNAGFNTLPACKLAAEDVFRRWPETEARAFFEAQREGQELVYELACAEQFELGACGKGIFQVAHSHGALAGLDEEGHWLRKAGIPCKILSREAFAEIGHAGPDQFGALHMVEGGGIDPMRLTLGLATAAQKYGAHLYARSPMQQWSKEGAWHVLQTPQGQVRARQVVVATNGYRDGEEPPALRNRALPAISNILVTAPLSEAQWQAIGLSSLSPMSDTRMLVTYYRRLPDNRLLLGARSDTWGDPQRDAHMQAALHQLIARKFPEAGPLPADYFWRGLVSVTRKLVPSWGRLDDDPTVLFTLGCFGSGVNTMPWMGRTLARAIAGQSLSVREQCAVFRNLPGRLPSRAWQQRLGLQLAYLHYGLQDRLV